MPDEWQDDAVDGLTWWELLGPFPKARDVGRINRSGTRTVVRIRTHYELIVTVTSRFCYAPV